MPPYCYSPLPPGPDNIRMLRLLPHEDEAAQIQCQLFDYSLYEPEWGRIHLYEALSYVWGTSETPESIFIEGQELPITTNLHLALRRLRDRVLERIIWVDAIAIDQKNDRERGHQVQLMAKIYSRARCVVIWLGEFADDSDSALEEIRLVARGDLPVMDDEWIKASFLALLNRQWFRRIWVLQEAAAARHILLICGSAEIDGHVFGLGVKKLNDCFGYLDSKDRTHLVTELIRDASFRSTCATNYLGEVSLDIRPLSELIDMFSAHEATDPRDKVYALLGMSSDDPEEARLLPDYEIGLAEFFQRLVQYLLSTKVTANTCSKGINPVIKSKGCVLGKVVSITDMGHDTVARVSFNCKVTYMGHQRDLYSSWTLQTSATSARKGDIVCLLEGALKPTIIRTCKDHFTVILIAATPPGEIRWAGQGNPMEPLDWSALLSLFEVFGRDFRLIWDWEGSSGDIKIQKESESTIKEPDQSIGLVDDFERMNRLLNVAQILEDVKDYEGAENRYQEAIKGYKNAVGETHPQTLIAMDSLARLYKKREQWDKTRSLLIEIFKLTERAKGAESQETLRKKDFVESFYRHQWTQVKTVGEEEMVRLLKQVLDDALLPEEDLLKIFKNFDVDVIGLLLQQNKDKDWITEDEIQVVARERKGHRFEVTEALFKAAVGNRDNAVDVIKLLLEQRGDAITVTNELIETMIKECNFSPEVIKEFPHNIANKEIE